MLTAFVIAMRTGASRPFMPPLPLMPADAIPLAQPVTAARFDDER
jgi:hypothetical protein